MTDSADEMKYEVEVAIAILHRDGQFLMQLRDDIPTIAHPGYWVFFGGHIELGETPEIALRRELLEEIGYAVTDVTKLGRYPGLKAMRHVFHAPLTVDLTCLVLREGWDLALLTPTDIQRGYHYSTRAGQTKPLVEAAQKILLEFIGLGETSTFK